MKAKCQFFFYWIYVTKNIDYNWSFPSSLFEYYFQILLIPGLPIGFSDSAPPGFLLCVFQMSFYPVCLSFHFVVLVTREA